MNLGAEGVSVGTDYKQACGKFWGCDEKALNSDYADGCTILQIC